MLAGLSHLPRWYAGRLLEVRHAFAFPFGPFRRRRAKERDAEHRVHHALAFLPIQGQNHQAGHGAGAGCARGKFTHLRRALALQRQINLARRVKVPSERRTARCLGCARHDRLTHWRAPRGSKGNRDKPPVALGARNILSCAAGGDTRRAIRHFRRRSV